MGYFEIKLIIALAFLGVTTSVYILSKLNLGTKNSVPKISITPYLDASFGMPGSSDKGSLIGSGFLTVFLGSGILTMFGSKYGFKSTEILAVYNIGEILLIIGLPLIVIGIRIEKMSSPEALLVAKSLAYLAIFASITINILYLIQPNIGF